jgi:hypothetical protein
MPVPFISTAPRAVSNTAVEIFVNRKLKKNSAENVNNYSITNLTVTCAVLDEDGTKVTLTTAPQITGRIYELLIQKIYDIDENVMEPFIKKFLGRGASEQTLPEVEGIIAVDDQTLEISFDRSVTDPSVEGNGMIWDKATNKLAAGSLFYVPCNNTPIDLHSLDEYAYQDPDNANILIVRVGLEKAFDPVHAAPTGKFTLIAAEDKVLYDEGSTAFDPTSQKPMSISIETVEALSANTIRVYFNQPVYGSMLNFARVGITSSYSEAAFFLASAVPANSTKTDYILVLSGDLASLSEYYLIVNPDVDCKIISDSPIESKYVTMRDNDTEALGIQQVCQFISIEILPSYIDNIVVVMNDAKTLDVYYWQDMDTSTEASAALSTNYVIVDQSGAPVTMSNGQPFNPLTDIADIIYHYGQDTARIVLNKTINASGSAYIKFGDIMNAALNATVRENAATPLMVEFGISTDPASKVSIDSAEFNILDSTLTITFNQKSYSMDVSSSYTKADFLRDFSITLGDSGYVLTANDFAQDPDTKMSSSSAADTINVKIIMSDFSLSYLTVEFGPDNTIVGINKERCDFDSSYSVALRDIR